MNPENRRLQKLLREAWGSGVEGEDYDAITAADAFLEPSTEDAGERATVCPTCGSDDPTLCRAGRDSEGRHSHPVWMTCASVGRGGLLRADAARCCPDDFHNPAPANTGEATFCPSCEGVTGHRLGCEFGLSANTGEVEAQERDYSEGSRYPSECRNCHQPVWIVYHGPRANHTLEPRAVEAVGQERGMSEQHDTDDRVFGLPCPELGPGLHDFVPASWKARAQEAEERADAYSNLIADAECTREMAETECRAQTARADSLEQQLREAQEDAATAHAWIAEEQAARLRGEAELARVRGEVRAHKQSKIALLRMDDLDRELYDALDSASPSPEEGE